MLPGYSWHLSDYKRIWRGPSSVRTQRSKQALVTGWASHKERQPKPRSSSGWKSLSRPGKGQIGVLGLLYRNNAAHRWAQRPGMGRG